MSYNLTNITAAAPTTTTVKTGNGTFHAITINKATANSVITVYDGTVATGKLLATITLPATLLKSQDNLIYDGAFSTSLTIVTSTAASDITVSWI